MQTIPEDKIENVLGKSNALFPRRLGKLRYVHGLPAFEALRTTEPAALQDAMNIKLLQSGLAISIASTLNTPLLYQTFGLAYADILQIALELPEYIVAQPQHSVLGRALLTNQLPGPTGTLVSQLCGLQSPSRAYPAYALLTLHVVQDFAESFLVAAVPRHRQAVVRTFLQKHLPSFA